MLLHSDHITVCYRRHDSDIHIIHRRLEFESDHVKTISLYHPLCIAHLHPFCVVSHSCTKSNFYKYVSYLFLLSDELSKILRSHVFVSASLDEHFFFNRDQNLRIFYLFIYFIGWSAFRDLTFSCLYLICLYSFHYVLFLLSMIFQLITSIMWRSTNFGNNISVSLILCHRLIVSL